MRQANANPPFGLLFSATAALISPTHEAITRKPLFGLLPPLQTRSALLTAFRKILAGIDVWHQRAEQRKRLRLLDDRMLRDVGLDRADLAEEVGKPFWRS